MGGLSVKTLEDLFAKARAGGLLHQIAASCPKMDAVGNDPCGAHYRDL